MFHHPYLEQEEKEERNHNEDKDRFTFNTGTGYRASGLPLGLSGERFSLKTPYPNPERFRQLWQIYLSNVHPVTMILHAPSASETLAEAVEGHGHASKETEALLFATMACALVSITDAACMRLLGEKRSVLLSMYLHGCERALARANFLISCNLGVLQAYTLYLVSFVSKSKGLRSLLNEQKWEIGGDWSTRRPQRSVEPDGDCQAECPEIGLTPKDINRGRHPFRSRDAPQTVVSDCHAGHHFCP